MDKMTKHGTIAVVLFLTLTMHAGAQNATPATPEVLRVTRYADDGNAGSLRWAIEQSNLAPGRWRIEIVANGTPPYVIKPASPLPPVKGPVQIEGAAWKKTGDFIVLDGSAYVENKGTQTCPGAIPGQFGANVRTTTHPGLALVETRGVDISGLEIRNFCIGVLIHRASHNVIHDNRIAGNRGGAGVMLTGDDGNGNSTLTTTLNNQVMRNEFIDNGDGLELTRGAAFNLVANNLFRSTGANPEPSQGIEVLQGHDNVMVSNRFEGYSDGIQVNSGNRNYIGFNTFTDNAFALSMTGVGNVIEGNFIFGNAVGIAMRATPVPTRARITRNAIYGNGQPIERCWMGGSCDPNIRKGGIVFGSPGNAHMGYVGNRAFGVPLDPARRVKICPDGAPNCDGPPNDGLTPPVLDNVRRTGTHVTVQGHVQGSPSSRFAVEVFGNRQSGGTEGETFLGEVVTTSDPNGQARFTLMLEPTLQVLPASFTATVTSAAGATSEFSKPVGLSE